MDETPVDNALNLDSSGTFELGRVMAQITAAEDDSVTPDFPALMHRRDPRHREFLTHVFDSPDFAP
jgi:hypothetical protein